MAQLDPGWRIAKDKKSISRRFQFSDFHHTMGFVNALAWIANQEDHHPELEIDYKHCLVRYTSHAAKGLTVNDFICAAKADTLYPGNVPVEQQPTDKTRAAASGTGDDTGRKTAPKPAATDRTPTPSLNPKEADELLEQTIERSNAGARQSDDDEDEFELINTADQPQPPAEEEKAIEETQEASAPESSPPPKAERRPVTGDKAEPESSGENIDLMATVILPPGMESVSPSGDDDDEEATVILPTNQTNSEQSGAEPASRERGVSPPPPEDLDEEKTMVIRPSEYQPPPQEPVTGGRATSQASGSTQADAAASQSRTQSARTGRQSPPPDRPAAGDTPEPPAQEEEAEKTMALSSDPLGRTNANKTTRASTEQTGKSETTGDQTEKDKPEREIEEDETLVMHSNTYKPVKKRE
jgi:4a-hydroxytetrahydrobiopterin dehydratase